MEGHILEHLGGSGSYFSLDCRLLASIKMDESFVALYRHQMTCYCYQSGSECCRMLHSVLNVRKAWISEYRFFFLPPAEDQLWPQQISTDSFKNRTLFHFSRMVLVWSYLKGGEWTRWPFKIFSILWYRGFMNSAHLIIWPSFTYAFIFPGQTSIQNFIQTANTIPLGSYLLLSIHTH